MSYDFSVYTCVRRLPTLAELQVLVSKSRPDLQFDDVVPLMELDGFFPATLGGAEAGFEVLIGPITDQERNEHREALATAPDQSDHGYLDALENSDVDFMFTCQTPAAIDAARTFAMELARATGGYFIDPQLGIFRRVDAQGT